MEKKPVTLVQCLREDACSQLIKEVNGGNLLLGFSFEWLQMPMGSATFAGT